MNNSLLLLFFLLLLLQMAKRNPIMNATMTQNALLLKMFKFNPLEGWPRLLVSSGPLNYNRDVIYPSLSPMQTLKFRFRVCALCHLTYMGNQHWGWMEGTLGMHCVLHG